MKLDYGSGSQPKEGFMSSDYIGTPNYDFYIKDYKVVDAKSHTFDIVHCRNVIHHIPECDLPRLFNEFKRLLRPDGKLIISEPRKEFHKRNQILDIVWYRFINKNFDIMIPQEYVDYRKYMKDFIIVSEEHEFSNEILTCKLMQ